MFLKKHISFLILFLIFSISFAGCKNREDYSSSPVIPGGEDTTHSNVSSDDTVTSDVSSTEPTQSSQTSSVNSSKPSKPPVTSTASHLHSFKVERVAPTCTEDGYTFYKCVECGETKIDSYVPKKGHSWGEWKTVTEATTASEGERERTCTVCKEKETEQIAMLTPDYDALRKELLELVNNERNEPDNSIGDFIVDPETQAKADKRLEEIIDKFETKQDDNYFEFIYRVQSLDGSLTAKDVFNYWSNNNDRESEYIKSIVSKEFTRTAIGVTVKDGKYYWVQIFLS